MNALPAKANWNIALGKLKQKVARLTEDEIQFAEGKHDELIGRIQKRKAQILEKPEPACGDASGCGCHNK